MSSSSRCTVLLLSAYGLALFAMSTFGVNAEILDNSSPQRLQVKVYYETLCPDSIRFVRRQLYPAMEDNKWLQYTDLLFVPYGKVSSWTDPTTNITAMYCQHGTAECELNALHACIVENNTVEEQLKMIDCMLAGYTTDKSDECSAAFEIDIKAAKQCKASRSTEDILKKYGEDTATIEISFVPSMAFDGVFDRWNQREILYQFEKVFCRKYKEKFNVTLDKC